MKRGSEGEKEKTVVVVVIEREIIYKEEEIKK
jgi:hypothetical protein